jgi:hypothetical protein
MMGLLFGKRIGNMYVRKIQWYLGATAVLAAGMAWSVLIYLDASAASESDLVNEFLESKRYMHEVKIYGGNISVLADEIARWVNSLWQGENRAFTTAAITISASIFLFLLGYHSSSHQDR